MGDGVVWCSLFVIPYVSDCRISCCGVGQDGVG